MLTTLTRNTSRQLAAGTKKGTAVHVRAARLTADFPEALVRLRRICQSAFDTVERQRFAEIDESYYDALRTALVDAGATDRETAVVAPCLVTIVVEATPDPTPDEQEIRREQFELICQHVARTRLLIVIGVGDAFIQVEFPDRPATH
jgi:hypothetical protein